MKAPESTTTPPKASPDASSKAAKTSRMLSVDEMERMEIERLDRIFGPAPEPKAD